MHHATQSGSVTNVLVELLNDLIVQMFDAIAECGKLAWQNHVYSIHKLYEHPLT